MGQQRLIVFERAAQVWGARLVSSVPVRVAAQFDPLSCTANQGVLGAAGPTVVIRDFAGAPLPNAWYAVALANALAGEDLDPDNDDIEATFNSDLGQADCLATLSWYYGLDGNEPPNSIDLLDTILHEFAHGLGFLSTVNLTTGGRLNGFNDAYIMHLEDHTTGKTYPEMTDTERRSASTDTGNLHWVGTNVVALSGILSSGRGPGGHVEIYAPDPVESGSSVSHFSNRLVPDELMEPFATPTSDMRLTVELFKDIGWRIASTGPSITANSSAVTSEDCGPANGVIDPAESVSVRLGLRNIGSGATSNLVATLLATGGVTAPGSPQNYGVVSVNGPEVARTFSFVANQACGRPLIATLRLQDGTNNLGTVTFNFKVGRSVSFTNRTSINVPLTGPGSPYPSTITVTGQPSSASSVTVTLFDVQHSSPDDLDILLVGPNGHTVVLASDAGGASDVSGVNVTFDDASADSLPDSSQIVSGAFKPTNIGVDDAFASPAPTGPYGTALSAFEGISANGTWSLYVVDDSRPRSGAVAGGWSLSFAICCSGNSSSNSPPVVMLSSSPVTYVENSAPVIIDPSGTITDPDSADFNGGQLIAQVATNGTSTDRLSIRNQGTNAGQIAIAGNIVTFGASVIGTFSGGEGSNPLIVDFSSASATLPAVQALLRNVTFHNVSEDPSVSSRTIRFTLSDGDGAFPLPVDRTLSVAAVNDAPILLPVSDSVVNEGATLVITNVASDPDTSAALLTFSVDSGPAGLEINAANGLLTWTPSEAQGPSTNTVRIAVADQGVPSLSSTQALNIIVLERNEPPVLAPIPDRTIHAGIALVFTNAAMDEDIPVNTLTFGLSNAPAGATLDPVTGLFSWTPGQEQANTTNLIAVTVTDSGAPLGTDTKTFSITVVSAPSIESITLAEGTITVTWRSVPGAVYRVEYKAALDESSWTELPGDVTATGPVTLKTDTIGPVSQRFYRVRILL